MKAQALVTLTENQFFRIEFLDSKMPGYKARPDELKAAQSAVAVIRKVLDKEKGYSSAIIWPAPAIRPA